MRTIRRNVNPKVMVGATIPVAEAESLYAYANANGISVSEAVRRALAASGFTSPRDQAAA
jgi:hypothetical protein